LKPCKRSGSWYWNNESIDAAMQGKSFKRMLRHANLYDAHRAWKIRSNRCLDVRALWSLEEHGHISKSKVCRAAPSDLICGTRKSLNATHRNAQWTPEMAVSPSMLVSSLSNCCLTESILYQSCALPTGVEALTGSVAH